MNEDLRLLVNDVYLIGFYLSKIMFSFLHSSENQIIDNSYLRTCRQLVFRAHSFF